MSQREHYDVIIVGGGLVGLVLAHALAQATMTVAVIESKQPPLDWSASQLDARVSAVNLASTRILQNLNVWQALRSQAISPLRKMIVWDSRGGGEIEFDSATIGVAQLGSIVENREMIRVLWQQLQSSEQVDLRCPAKPSKLECHNEHVKLILSNQQTITASLIVGADGGRSWVREQMQTPWLERPYEQEAMVAIVNTKKPHQETAWQNFLSQGTIALLPLANKHHAAMIWSSEKTHAASLLERSQVQFNREVTNALDHRLGEIEVLNEPRAIPLVMRHAKHYVSERIALIGDAAHTIHPLAGQGVNLGFMDAATLAEVAIDAKHKKQDIGALKPLRRYERWRKGDNTMMLMAMRGFKEVFASEAPWLITTRSMGLNFTERFPGLKNFFIRYAVGKSSDLPILARP